MPSFDYRNMFKRKAETDWHPTREQFVDACEKAFDFLFQSHGLNGMQAHLAQMEERIEALELAVEHLNHE